MKNLKRPVNSLLKAAKIVETFTSQEHELGASEMARKVSLPRPTVHRLMSTLAQIHWLEWDESKKKYGIGPELYMIGNLYVENKSILTRIEPVAEMLNELSKESVVAAIFDHANVMEIMRIDARYEPRFILPTSRLRIAHVTSVGKALLSELSESEIDSLFPDENLMQRTKKTIKTKSELKRELEKIRKSGISYDDEENWDGFAGIASLVRDSSGKGILAMSIGIPVFRLNGVEARENLTTLVRKCCDLASYRLGYRDSRRHIRSLQEIRSWWHKKCN
ncbi:IclR family transcriptional regulator [Chloroflexota bacterium]